MANRNPGNAFDAPRETGRIPRVITEVRLRHFRCFDALDFQPGPGRTCIVGQNAQGKTSILEAVCVLLRLQSPRTSTPVEMIQAGQAACALEGRVGDSHLACRFAPGSRELTLDSKPQSRSDDYLSVARITWFANSDLELVKGSGSVRRRFLDFLGMQSVPGYRKALRDYERTLRSRNALLKEGRPRREIAAFDPPLIEAGEVLVKARVMLVEAITPLAQSACVMRSLTKLIMRSSLTKPPDSMTAFASRPKGVPALTAARSMSPVEIWGMLYLLQMNEA